MRGITLPQGDLLPFAQKWILIALCTLMLGACSLADDSSAGNGPAPSAAAAPTQPAAPTPMDTFRALAPPEGLKFTPLFASDVKDDDARFVRLESAVQNLRNDFDTVTPTLVRMVAIEKDIKKLVGQLQTLTDEQNGVSSAPVEPMELAPPPLPDTATSNNEIPGEDIAGGTDTAPTDQSGMVAKAPSSLVTPEATPEGNKPPDGVASPDSQVPMEAQQGDMPLPPPAAPAQVQAPTNGSALLAPAATAPAADNSAASIEDAAAAAQTGTTPQASPAPQNSASPAPQNAAAPAAPVTAKPTASAASQTQGSVGAIRVGDHPDATRIVIEVDAKTEYDVQLANDGRQLIVALPAMQWKAAQAQSFKNGKLVSAYKNEDGLLTFELLKAATIKSKTILPPSAQNPAYRIVIDLALLN